MQEYCQCGHTIQLELRTVIFAGKVSITQVPVMSCEECSYYELLPCVKEELKQYLAELGSEPETIRISFADRNELSSLILTSKLYGVQLTPSTARQLMKAVNERINTLLDVYRYAQSSGDQDWTQDIERRLSQLSTLSSYPILSASS
ncbi:hypothetical protein Q5741_02510 [Paenibacillus sp. JX-17]|uniref:YgiT-type zinc finger protein n=1 Tax=Paenibacillus lacisoli TaxID=3064525 RepID=A0ABT9C7P5_9BACL|nr:hypothetical protein [Paenibacillus sp. JX-17]MDO7905285.1 hypothetical protein [Paenibacillus sp. JX-17]